MDDEFDHNSTHHLVTLDFANTSSAQWLFSICGQKEKKSTSILSEQIKKDCHLPFFGEKKAFMKLPRLKTRGQFINETG